jgi:hypothetical protein
MKLAIDSRYAALREYLDVVKATRHDDPVAAQLRRFGSALICGFVERSVEIIILERLKKRAHERVLNFIKAHFERGINFKCSAIHDLLARFDHGWAARYDNWMSENERHVEALKSIYAIRNSVAHGGTMNTSAAALESYAHAAYEVVSALIEVTKK